MVKNYSASKGQNVVKDQGDILPLLYSTRVCIAPFLRPPVLRSKYGERYN